MNLTLSQKVSRFPSHLLESLRGRPDVVYMAIIAAALLAFEVFSFSTTDFALRSLVGSQSAAGMTWSTILALAFCGMDFAGIAQLLAPHAEKEGSRASWFLLGAWVLAAAANAGLTWWAVSIAVYNQPANSALIVDPLAFVTAVPVLVALFVWVLRILVIGTLVSSLGKSLHAPAPSRAPAKAQPLDFRSGAQTAPAGYHPVPNPARAQHDADYR